MTGRRRWRTYAATAAAAALPLALGLAVPPAWSAPPPRGAYAQTQCVLPGERGDPVAAVPWAQHLLAPDRAWPLTDGAGQRVAVLGTGVGDTPFLPDRVVARVDLAPEPEFGEPSGQVDCLGIGTGVAGLIAARKISGMGFHGVAPGARILDIKIVGDTFPRDREPAGTVPPDLIATAIDQAVERDATVIVVPIITYEESDSLRDTVAAAISAGVVVVASVGEAGEDDEPSDRMPYPATHPDVIGVGAIGADGNAGLSRADHVDLVAPGGDLLVTHPGDGLGPTAGTGFAAGYVAGAVALLRAYRPDLSPQQVAHRLFATAAPAPETTGSARYGHGIVDPYRAMVDEVVVQAPQPQRPYVPVVTSQEELAREAARQRSERMATRLALAGMLVVAVGVAVVAFGASGRRRRWRTGLAASVPDQPDDDRPEPPMDLFGERPGPSG